MTRDFTRCNKFGVVWLPCLLCALASLFSPYSNTPRATLGRLLSFHLIRITPSSDGACFCLTLSAMFKSQSSRRTVFADVQHNNVAYQPTSGYSATSNYPSKVPSSPPPAKAKDEKAASPPLPRQNSKAVPPSPPAIIRDMGKTLMFTRMGMLGEGGFARVYEVKDMRGKKMAIKVVTKASLKTKKAKTKVRRLFFQTPSIG